MRVKRWWGGGQWVWPIGAGWGRGRVVFLSSFLFFIFSILFFSLLVVEVGLRAGSDIIISVGTVLFPWSQKCQKISGTPPPITIPVLFPFILYPVIVSLNSTEITAVVNKYIHLHTLYHHRTVTKAGWLERPPRTRKVGCSNSRRIIPKT